MLKLWDMPEMTLHLFKQNFKFSAARFLIFDAKSAEKLHGHNYQVRVDIGCPAEIANAASGYFVDFNVFKTYIKTRLDAWDEHILLPARQPEMSFETKGASLEVRFRDRFYVFPENEVIRLPVTNTSVEQLSRLLAEDFAQEFKKVGVTSVTVTVEETAGQGASTKVLA